MLFSLCTKYLMWEWYGCTSHLRAPNVSGISIKEIRYTDGIVMAQSSTDAEEMLAILGDISDWYRRVIHPGKMEYMVVQQTMDDDTITYHLILIPCMTFQVPGRVDQPHSR